MFKDIVVGISNTPSDDHALKAAVYFAKRFEANLYPVHVAGMEQGWGSIETLEASGELRKIESELTESLRPYWAEVSEVDVLVEAGVPQIGILRQARRVRADLIIMGAHTNQDEVRRSQMWGMAGSTLEHVSQRARCPVMIVHEGVRLGDPLFGKILVATDFSEHARCAVAYGSQLARHYNSEMTLMHVVKASGGMTPVEVKVALQQEYGEKLAGISTCEYTGTCGDPAVEIWKMVDKVQADLAILAHHSKEIDPERAFLGSTVAYVALNSSCPTMSVNHHFDLRCGMHYDQHGGSE